MFADGLPTANRMESGIGRAFADVGEVFPSRVPPSDTERSPPDSEVAESETLG